MNNDNDKPFDPLAPQNVGLDNVKNVDNKSNNSFVSSNSLSNNQVTENQNNYNLNNGSNNFLEKNTNPPTNIESTTPSSNDTFVEPIVKEEPKVSPIGDDNREKLLEPTPPSGPYIPKDKVKETTGKVGVIVAFVLIIGMIITIQFWPQLSRSDIYKEKKTLEEKEENIKNFKSLDNPAPQDFQGKYKNENSVVKIYNNSVNTIWFSYKSKDKNISALARVGNGSLYFDKGLKLDVKVGENKDSILINFNENTVHKELFTKESSYTFDEYFNDFYIDDDKYLKTQYNGCFSNGETILCMYQADNDVVRIDAGGVIRLTMDFKIKEDGSLSDKGYKISFKTDKTIIFEKNDESLELSYTNDLNKKQIASVFSNYYE